MPRHLWSIPRLLEAASCDLLGQRESYSEAIQQSFFIRREAEGRLLDARIDEIEAFGGNVLLVGDPGTGKSSFIHWFLNDSRFAQNYQPNQYTFDLKSTGINTTEDAFLFGTRSKLTDAALKYIEESTGDPCHHIRRSNEINTSEEAMTSFVKTTETLVRMDRKPRKLYLFVDDLDYIEPRFFSLLTAHLRPFLMSPNCCVVLAARRPAFNAIIGCDDFMIGHFFDHRMTVELSHLEVSDVLLARLASIPRGRFRYQEIVGQISDKFFALCEAFKECVGEHPHEDEFEISALPYTAKQLSFIQDVSNGNVREMMRLAKAIASYLATHFHELEHRADGTIKIGRPRLLDEFKDESKYGSLHVQNLHSRKSGASFLSKNALPPAKIGNSLYVLLLETLMDFASLNSSQRERLKEFGFSDAEIDEGIQEIFQMGMIEEKYIVDQRALGQRIPWTRDYVLTKRGNYYVSYMIHWDEYIDLFGRSTHHLLGTSANVRAFVDRVVLQFIAAIGLRWSLGKKSSKDFAKVQKSEFVSELTEQAKGLLVWANRNDKIKPIEIGEASIQSILVSLEVVKLRGIDEATTFLLHFDRAKKRCADLGIAWEVAPPFTEDAVDRFVENYLREAQSR